MEKEIKLWIYKRKKVEYILKVSEDNKIKLRFVLEKEVESIRDKLRELKDKGIIKSIKSNPKTKDKKYKELLEDLLSCRKSILNAIKSIQ